MSVSVSVFQNIGYQFGISVYRPKTTADGGKFDDVHSFRRIPQRHGQTDRKISRCAYYDSTKGCFENKQEFVRPRWPYDMRPSVRAEKYIRDAGP